VQAARRLAKRAFRAREGRFLAEGPQAVRAAVDRAGTVLEVFATRDAAARHPEILAAAGGAGTPVHLVSGEVMTALAQTVTPQGLVAVCSALDRPLAEVLADLRQTHADYRRLVEQLPDDAWNDPHYLAWHPHDYSWVWLLVSGSFGHNDDHLDYLQDYLTQLGISKLPSP